MSSLMVQWIIKCDRTEDLVVEVEADLVSFVKKILQRLNKIVCKRKSKHHASRHRERILPRNELLKSASKSGDIKFHWFQRMMS